MTRLQFALVGVLVFIVLAGGAYAVRARGEQVAPATVAVKDDLPRAPEGVRVRVQVLNTTRTRGLARRATRMLRDHGFDVVEVGTSRDIRDTTLVLDRSGHPAWAASVAKILGHAARTEVRIDSSRYLDVTVLLGRTWRPPSEPLDP